MELLILSILRLTVPLTIIKFPLLGFILAIILDALDWILFPFNTPDDYIYYQTWDKLLDIYFMGISLIAVLRWKDNLAKKTAIILFLTRFLGIILAMITSFREFYLFFPNMYISFFLFTMIYMKLKKQTKVFTSKTELIIILIALFLPTLIGEYYVHFNRKLPWEYSWGRFLEGPEIYVLLVNQLTWFLFFLSVPVIIFIIKINRDKPSLH